MTIFFVFGPFLTFFVSKCSKKSQLNDIGTYNIVLRLFLGYKDLIFCSFALGFLHFAKRRSNFLNFVLFRIFLHFSNCFCKSSFLRENNFSSRPYISTPGRGSCFVDIGPDKYGNLVPASTTCKCGVGFTGSRCQTEETSEGGSGSPKPCVRSDGRNLCGSEEGRGECREVSLSTFIFFCLSVSLCVCLSVRLSAYLSVCLSVCLSACLSVS